MVRGSEGKCLNSSRSRVELMSTRYIISGVLPKGFKVSNFVSTNERSILDGWVSLNKIWTVLFVPVRFMNDNASYPSINTN